MSIISNIGEIFGRTLTGKILVSNLLKFVPGIGTVAGGFMSDSVASVMTLDLGMSYMNVMKYSKYKTNQFYKLF